MNDGLARGIGCLRNSAEQRTRPVLNLVLEKDHARRLLDCGNSRVFCRGNRVRPFLRTGEV